MTTTGQQRPSAGLGTRAARGGLVTFMGQGARILIQLISVVVLARLLAPHDYGLIAIVVAMVGLGEIFRDFGLSTAAIQAPILTNGQRNNLFWLNTAIGAVLTVIAIASAPLIAAFYHQSELVPIMRAVSFTFLMNGLATQYRADLTRNLRFSALSVANTLSPLFGLAFAVVAATMGAAYWALVGQQLIQSFSLLVMFAVIARWLPGLPNGGASVRPFVRFGWNMASGQLLTYVGNNLDTMLIGYRFGPALLGVYTRGYQLLMTPLTQLRAPTSTVAIPVLSKLQNDKERFGKFVERGQIVLGYSIVAILGLVVGAAIPATDLILGHQWLASAPIVRLLAIAGSFQTLAYVGYWVYTTRGLAASLFRYSLVSVGVKVVCIIIGSFWGIIGVAAAAAIAPGLTWPLSIWWLSRQTTIPARALTMGALRIVGMTAASAAAAFEATQFLHGAGDVAQLALALVASAVVYAGGYAVLPAVRRDIKGLLGIGSMMVARRSSTALSEVAT